MKKTFAVFSLAAVFVAGIALPTLSSAQSANMGIGDLQSQVKALLAQVAELTKQLNELLGKSPVSIALPTIVPPLPVDSAYPHQKICRITSRNLSLGARGDDVSALQEFLYEEKYLPVKPTGYYGELTREAVTKWQAAESIARAGAFGPLSRKRMKLLCEGSALMQARPRSGAAPLVVTFTIRGDVGGLSPYAYALDFGDGQILENVQCPMSPNFPDKCFGPLVVEHRYEKPGAYTALLWRYVSGGVSVRTAVAKANIHAGEALPCARVYAPVCGAKPIVCITTPCDPVPTTYGNKCEMEADGAEFLYRGRCQTVKDPPAVCTLEYNPVCGQPQGCENTCPPGMYCAMMCKLPDPKTYSNKCFLAAENATFLHEGECAAADL